MGSPRRCRPFRRKSCLCIKAVFGAEATLLVQLRQGIIGETEPVLQVPWQDPELGGRGLEDRPVQLREGLKDERIPLERSPEQLTRVVGYRVGRLHLVPSLGAVVALIIYNGGLALLVPYGGQVSEGGLKGETTLQGLLHEPLLALGALGVVVLPDLFLRLRAEKNGYCKNDPFRRGHYLTTSR